MVKTAFLYILCTENSFRSMRMYVQHNFFSLFRLNKMKRHSKENSKACSCTNQIFNIEKIEMCTFG